jgi:hypothetical protein
MKHHISLGILAGIGLLLLGLVFLGCSGGGDGGEETPAPEENTTPPGTTPPGGNSAPVGGTIPQRAQYSIQITGRANQGGEPTSTFTLNATLVVVPTVDPRAIGVRNGPNPVDVAIITADSPLQGVAGALWFGTNTSFCSLIGCTTGASAIDTAVVMADARRGTVIITVDGDVFGQPTARLNVFNIFNIRTGLTAQIYHVLAGGITIQFTNGGQSVSGTIDLGGNSGFSGPAVTTEYSATFRGTRSNE